MKKNWNKFCEEESGQGMVEYGLILSLIAVALIAVLSSVRDTLKNTYEKAHQDMSSAIVAS